MTFSVWLILILTVTDESKLLTGNLFLDGNNLMYKRHFYVYCRSFLLPNEMTVTFCYKIVLLQFALSSNTGLMFSDSSLWKMAVPLNLYMLWAHRGPTAGTNENGG